MYLVKITDVNGFTYIMEYKSPQSQRRMATIYKKNGWDTTSYEDDKYPDNCAVVRKVKEKRREEHA